MLSTRDYLILLITNMSHKNHFFYSEHLFYLNLNSLLSSLSSITSLFSVLSFSPMPCDCSWWFHGCALMIRGFDLVGEVIRHGGDVGLIWWVSVAWLFCLGGLIWWVSSTEGSEMWRSKGRP